MSKKRTKKETLAQPKAQPLGQWWIMGGVALLLIGLGLWLMLGTTDLERGTPKLVVDQTVVDEGYQKLDTVVRTSFTLRNDGDAPLRILGEPRVQLVEGC